MSWSAVLQAFAAVLPAELPDKSMFATIVLVTRYRRPRWVWLGVVSAFAVHVTVAVIAGSLLGLLPDVVVQAVVTVLFAAGAVLLVRAARSAAAAPEQTEVVPLASVRTTVLGSFGVIAVAEWGDLTQLATASLAASTGEPFAVALGAWLALATVAAVAATFGQQLVRRVPLHRVNALGAAIFAGLALWSFAELLADLR
jgi:putative Ca2+/H+ antiporter (TMEM165/GDT1 family)